MEARIRMQQQHCKPGPGNLVSGSFRVFTNKESAVGGNTTTLSRGVKVE